MKKWQIKTKKDWCITFIFVFLLLWVLAEYNNYFVKKFLTRFYPDKMNITCCPEWCDVLLIVIAGMTVFTTIVLIWKKKPVKLWGSVIILGVLLSVGAVAAFRYHCRLIVEVAEKSQPLDALINFQDFSQSLDMQGNDERALKLSRLVYELEPLPEKEREALRKKEREYETFIWIRYPEKYGQSYWLQCHVDGKEIYMQKEQGFPAVFYKDNGLLAYLKELEKDSK